MKFIGKLVVVVIIIANLFSYSANALEKKNYNLVKPIINAFQSNNKELISTLILYPLKRKTPLLPIKNKTEFLTKYDEIFDKKLIKIISQSNINEDWASVGWRGIMLSNGLLWLNTDGKIRSINYESDFEKTYRNKIISEQKNQLHKSLQNYEQPILNWATRKFHVRIDRLKNNTYRYAAWPINKKTTLIPSIILFNGEQIFDGSGGNHHYVFKNGQFKYICYVSVLSATDTLGSLEVFKGKKLLLSEKVVKSFY